MSFKWVFLKTFPHQNYEYVPIVFVTYPYSTALLEKLAGSQLVTEFPAFYGTQMFLTAFRRVRHLPRQLLTFRNMAIFFTVTSCRHPAQSPSRMTTSRRLSATAYSIYSQRPSILQADPRSVV